MKPVLGVLEGCAYTAMVEPSFVLRSRTDPTKQRLYLVKFHNPPAGRSEVDYWVADKKNRKMPNNLFFRDVLQVNLQAHAWKCKTGFSPSAHIIWAGSKGVKRFSLKGTHVLPPPILSSVVIPLAHLISDVLKVTPAQDRQLLNAAWTFEALRFAMFPGLGITDTQANTNLLRRYVLSMLSKDGNNKNIIAAQCLLEDQQGRTMNKFMCILLPKILPTKALRKVNAFPMDGDLQLRGSVGAGKAHDILNKSVVVIPCSFHSINQEIQDLLTSRVPTHVIELIKGTLYDVNRRYETEDEARRALICLLVYAANTLDGNNFKTLDEYVGKQYSTLPKWGFFAMLLILTFNTYTTSSIEGDHGVTKRTKTGGMGLGKSSGLTAILEMRQGAVQTRAANSTLQTATHASGFITSDPQELRQMSHFLTDYGYQRQVKLFNRLKHLKMEFVDSENPHWYICIC
jgi:hypothetical protein